MARSKTQVHGTNFLDAPPPHPHTTVALKLSRKLMAVSHVHIAIPQSLRLLRSAPFAPKLSPRISSPKKRFSFSSFSISATAMASPSPVPKVLNLLLLRLLLLCRIGLLSCFNVGLLGFGSDCQWHGADGGRDHHRRSATSWSWCYCCLCGETATRRCLPWNQDRRRCFDYWLQPKRLRSHQSTST